MTGRRLGLYVLGVVLAAAAGFCSPWPWAGFLPLSAGCVWGSYDVYDDGEELAGGNPSPTSAR